MQEEKKQKFRDELENITRELVKLNNEFEILQQQIDEIDEVEENAEMKELCSQK
jgi:ppGpp synthetase/RelA/SpoT-type nucleotidyltranferase